MDSNGFISQAEHDEDAQSILLCPDLAFIDKVEKSIEKLLPSMDRKDIIKTALKNRGALIHTIDMDEAIAISNRIAPEHLELSVENPEALLDNIKHAGAIFMGKYTCEALGDLCRSKPCATNLWHCEILFTTRCLRFPEKIKSDYGFT